MTARTTLITLLISLLLHIHLVSQDNSNVAAQKNGHILTKEHVTIYAQGLISDGTLDPDASQEVFNEVVIELLEEFDEDPEGVLDFIEYYKEILNDEVNLSKDEVKLSKDSKGEYPTGSISTGNQIVRDALGSDIGQMNFDSDEASAFRKYVSNSLFYDSSTSSSQHYGGSNYRSSSAQIYFCEDGSYVQILSAQVSVDVDGAYASSGGDDDIQKGYWEVATLPNGLYILLFYSTEASMLEEVPNGFLPFPITSYTETYVVMPDGSVGYQREGGHSCK